MKNLEPELVATFAPAPAAPRRGRFFRVLAVSLAGIVLVAGLFHVAVNVWLSRSMRPRVEQALSKRLPGASLRLGLLRYDFWRDRLRGESLELAMPDGARAQIGTFALEGVHWTGLLAEKPDPWQLLRDARLEVAEVSAGLAGGEYRVRCGRLAVSVPAGEIKAQSLALQPAVSDEAFFAADEFRRVRYRAAIASGTARGVNFPELLNGRAYRVEAVELKAPQFESLSDREKPPRARTHIPPMPHEALAALEQPLRVGRFTVTDGSVRLMGRRFEGAEPGVLTFTGVGIMANEIANKASGGRSIAVALEGKLMDAGAMTVQMSLPVDSASLAFHYSGALGPMDLTRLNEYLSGTGGFELKSGRTDGASFDIEVVDGQARGTLKGIYSDLHVTALDRATGSEKGVKPRVVTVLANQMKVRHENLPDAAGQMREGKIDYARTPEDTFLRYAWNALRTGIVDLLTL